MNDPENILNEEFSRELNKLRNTNTFKVPEAYFDTFPAMIRERIIAVNNERSHSPEFFNKLAFPALLAVFIILTGIWLLNPNAVKQQKQLTAEDIHRVIANDKLHLFDETLLVESLPKDAYIAENSYNPEDEEVIDYLIENNVSLSSIINDF